MTFMDSIECLRFGIKSGYHIIQGRIMSTSNMMMVEYLKVEPLVKWRRQHGGTAQNEV